MLSGRLLNRIEAHWENIAADAVLAAHTDARSAHYRTLDEESLRNRARDLVSNLRHWLNAGEDDATERRYRALGQTRFQQGFPLHEVVTAIQLIERKIEDYIQSENAAQNAVDLYAELEMLRALHRYFQVVQRSVVEGYEREAQAAHAWQLSRAS